MSHLFINNICNVSSRQKWQSNEAQEFRQKFWTTFRTVSDPQNDCLEDWLLRVDLPSVNQSQALQWNNTCVIKHLYSSRTTKNMKDLAKLLGQSLCQVEIGEKSDNESCKSLGKCFQNDGLDHSTLSLLPLYLWESVKRHHTLYYVLCYIDTFWMFRMDY